MGAGGANIAGDVQRRDGSGGGRVGGDGPHTERKGGVQGHQASRGVVEGVLSCG